MTEPKRAVLMVGDGFGEEAKALERKGFFVMLYSNGVEPCDAVGGGLLYDCALVDLELPSTCNGYKRAGCFGVPEKTLSIKTSDH